jgi:hypothetical protein
VEYSSSRAILPPPPTSKQAARSLKRWAVYQTEAIENCYSVWKSQDFSEKKNIFKIQKQLLFGQKMANHWQIFL